MVLMKINTDKMSPLGSREITDGIYAIMDDIVNMYLIENNCKYIAVDSGKNKENINEEIGSIQK